MSEHDEQRFSGPDPGLCAVCRHVHRNETRKGTVYWRCTRAATDPRFPKYPRLPVLTCPGFEPERSEPEHAEPAPD
ncbi:hypothetical protein ABH935_008406 [Catenulispora sp. GAS73]